MLLRVGIVLHVAGKCWTAPRMHRQGLRMQLQLLAWVAAALQEVADGPPAAASAAVAAVC